jgi:hypothetical protein
MAGDYVLESERLVGRACTLLFPPVTGRISPSCLFANRLVSHEGLIDRIPKT